MNQKQEKRNLFVRLRMTENEKKEVQKLANARKLKVSAYFRFCIQKVELLEVENAIIKHEGVLKSSLS